MEDVPRYVNDCIVRCLAGVCRAGRPLFLKIPYFGPQAMEDGLGEGSSPALLGTTLIVVVDHELQSFVVAIDKRS